MYMTKPEKRQFLARWETRRADGKLRFVLLDTSVFFAIILVMMILFDLIDHSLAESITRNFAPHKLIFRTILCALLGALQWHSNERLYRKLINRQT